MQEEIDSVLENETRILASLPRGREVLDGKWVYNIKTVWSIVRPRVVRPAVERR